MKKLILLSTLTVASFSSLATDYGVELAWNTNDSEQVLKTLPEQKVAFSQLIQQGDVKDMFVLPSSIDGKPVHILRFVLSADNEAEVATKLQDLPMYQQDLVKIASIQSLGAKWLDNTPESDNYSVTLRWKEGIEALEMDRVLGVDLQRVISLNNSGLVTSSYINTQVLDNGVERPIYSVAVLAKDAQQAQNLMYSFEAVQLGYATFEIEYLGKKLDMKS
ncbi:hypothetical protein F0262_14875 [Vibrio rotiferianus]|uniref:Uncharacterized protein n=1 Tax=Vibrio rotiferianus TaxID=190895 RepID=A0A7Y4E2K8_9VIBR|nr:hypothetical protein [Vibrio rotiferianus]NOH49333.1 hypothetical protein [Vibrio rotiferianus]